VVVDVVTRIEAKRHPEGGGSIGKTELRAHHADDSAGSVVQRDRFADDVRVGAEAASPEGMTEDNDTLFRRFLVRGQGKAAEEGARLDHAEKIPQYAGAVETFGLSFAGEHHRRWTHRGDLHRLRVTR